MRWWLAVPVLVLVSVRAHAQSPDQPDTDLRALQEPVLARAALADWRAASPQLTAEPGLEAIDLRAAMTFARLAERFCDIAAYRQSVNVSDRERTATYDESYKTCMAERHANWLAVEPKPSKRVGSTLPAIRIPAPATAPRVVCSRPETEQELGSTTIRCSDAPTQLGWPAEQAAQRSSVVSMTPPSQ